MAENAASENTYGDFGGPHSCPRKEQEVKKRSKQFKQRKGMTDSRQYTI